MAAKFTYDTTAKLFILNSGVTLLDAKADFYSEVKRDWKDTASLTKFKFPILGIGGQSLGGVQTISAYYALQDGWKIRPQEANHELTILGNIISSDGSDPYASVIGNYTVRIKAVVSSSSITTSSADLAPVVWSNTKALPMAKYLALKGSWI